MKRILILMTMALLIMMFGWATMARAQDDVGFFYSQLAPYGQWLQIPTYGWVWSPGNVPIGWRPYSGDGHWVQSDQGLTFVPDQEWGWITYHYGRWIYGPDYGYDYGWLWIPGTVWSPGWVAWRYGQGQDQGVVGWAPLPPDRYWDPWLFSDNFDFDDIGYFWWSFVDTDDLFLNNVGPRILSLSANDLLIRGTRDVTRFRLDNGRVIDASLDERLNGLARGREQNRYQVGDLRSMEGGHAGVVRGHELAVYRPVIGLNNSGTELAGVRNGQNATPNREIAGFQAGQVRAFGLQPNGEQHVGVAQTSRGEGVPVQGNARVEHGNGAPSNFNLSGPIRYPQVVPNPFVNHAWADQGVAGRNGAGAGFSGGPVAGFRGGNGGGISRPSGGFSSPGGGFSRPSGGFSRPSGGGSSRPSGGFSGGRGGETHRGR